MPPGFWPALPGGTRVEVPPEEQAMWFYVNSKDELKRVPDGARIELTCGSCKKKATFYEAGISQKFSLYVVLPIWKKERHVMQCGECLAVCDYTDVFPADEARKAQAPEPEPEKTRLDFAGQFQGMSDFLGNTAKNVFNKFDQLTFKMLVDNLKSSDTDAVFEAIEQIAREKKPLGVPPLYFVSRAHSHEIVRARAAKALDQMGYATEIEKLTAGKSIEESTRLLITHYGHYRA